VEGIVTGSNGAGVVRPALVTTRRIALCLLVFLVLLALEACGGSKSATSASPSPTASRSVAARLVTPPGWGIQFRVADPLSDATAWKDPSGRYEAVSFETKSTLEGGELIRIVRIPEPKPIDIGRWIRNLDRRQLLRFLPRKAGKRSGLFFWAKPAKTTVGPGWPGVTTRFWVVLTPDVDALFGQWTMGCETSVFWYEGHVYMVGMVVTPNDAFAAHRAELELTLQTMAPAKSGDTEQAAEQKESGPWASDRREAATRFCVASGRFPQVAE
jgi:hypothetical protein